MNPGGPGGSGVDLVEDMGWLLDMVVPGFDLIGFDPRGVGGSSRVSCMEDLDDQVFVLEDGEDPTALFEWTEAVWAVCLKKSGDLALFYHSNTQPPGIAGIMEIVREGYPDHTAFDPESKYYDPKSDPDNPRWYMVDVQFKRRLRRYLPLPELKANPALADMPLVRKGNRLSVMPLTEQQWQAVLDMEAMRGDGDAA